TTSSGQVGAADWFMTNTDFMYSILPQSGHPLVTPSGDGSVADFGAQGARTFQIAGRKRPDQIPQTAFQGRIVDQLPRVLLRRFLELLKQAALQDLSQAGPLIRIGMQQLVE